jgi:hypothetical protein
VIDAIQLTALACKTDAATRALALQAVSRHDRRWPQLLPTASHPIARIPAHGPGHRAAWTAPAVNALRAGPKVTV